MCKTFKWHLGRNNTRGTKKFSLYFSVRSFIKPPQLKWRFTDAVHFCIVMKGSFARGMIPSFRRFKALLCFLKPVTSRATEDLQDRLRKVPFLYDHVHQKCQTLYKPGQLLSFDQRMIKSKARFSFEQCLQKTCEVVFQEVCFCDAETAILCNFQLFTG